MSPEQPAIRSVRALWQARKKRADATPAPGTPAAGAVPPTPDTPASAVPAQAAGVTGRHRIPGPVDTVRSTASTGQSSRDGDPASGGPPTRRQLRLSRPAAETGPATAAGVSVPAGPGAQGPAGMTVEQALAARTLLSRQAENQLAKMNHINAADPGAIDPQALAGQAGTANQAGTPGPDARPGSVRNDPATVNNLAMVTPLEFIEVPGIERPVLKRPATSHIPVVTTESARVDPARQPRPGAGSPAVKSTGEDPGGRAPVAATAARGLDPLDADTAGLGRVRRLRLLQLTVLGLGVVALITGIILVITVLPG